MSISNDSGFYSAEPKKWYLFDLLIDLMASIVSINLLVQHYNFLNLLGKHDYSILLELLPLPQSKTYQIWQFTPNIALKAIH